MGLLNRLEGRDSVEEVAVAFYPVLGHYRSAFSLDETFAFKGAEIFCYGVFSHAHRLANRFIAGPALVRFPIFTADQIEIDSQFTGAELEEKNLVGEWERVPVAAC